MTFLTNSKNVGAFAFDRIGYNCQLIHKIVVALKDFSISI